MQNQTLKTETSDPTVRFLRLFRQYGYSVTGMAKKLGINKGHVSLAKNHDYISPMLYKAMGMPTCEAVPVCPDCNEVHTYDCNTQRATRKPTPPKPGAPYKFAATLPAKYRHQVKELGVSNADIVKAGIEALYKRKGR